MEGMIPAINVGVTEPTHVSEARRTALRLAQDLAFSDVVQGRLALVVTEIAANVLKHAKGGRIVLSPAMQADAIDIFGLDQGPGISNLAQCLQDGFSTAGSPGTGLGAIERQSDEWDVFTSPGKGTVIRARLNRGKPQPVGSPFETAGVVIPYPGYSESGDAWAARVTPGKLTLLAVDGLGHGPSAADAANAAVASFNARSDLSGAALMEEIGRALRSTRGAAVGLAEIAAGSGTLSYTGVGNIAGVIFTDDLSSKHLVSMNGIVGHYTQRIRSFEYPWRPDSLLILHSDGLRTRWNLADYPGLAMRSPALIAAVLLRDAERGTDDALIAVVRARNPQHAI
jgi:anti-sigma regulatory factor (Ser/Thr protein kinase)